MQVDSIKTRVESGAYGVCNQRLKLLYDELLSNLAFRFNLRRYTMDPAAAAAAGRGLHSSTSRLNVSTFCGIRRVCGWS